MTSAFRIIQKADSLDLPKTMVFIKTVEKFHSISCHGLNFSFFHHPVLKSRLSFCFVWLFEPLKPLASQKPGQWPTFMIPRQKQTLNWLRFYRWRELVPESQPVMLTFSKQILRKDGHTTNPDAMFPPPNRLLTRVR
jgi:hypothetical protein